MTYFGNGDLTQLHHTMRRDNTTKKLLHLPTGTLWHDLKSAGYTLTVISSMSPVGGAIVVKKEGREVEKEVKFWKFDLLEFH